MKLSILQQDLLPALQAVSRSAGIKASLPVLANILLQTESGKLKLSATNLEIGVVKKISAKILEDGEVTVPVKTFLETISSLSGTTIELEANEAQLKIKTDNFKANLNGIPASEFPAIPLSSENTLLIEASALNTSIPQISFAAAVDEGRPVLTGILTQIQGDNLELVATDGFRLAHKKMTLQTAVSSFKALIPRRTFEEIVRLIEEELKKEDQEEEKVQISTSDNQNQLIFKVGQTELSSRLIEGQFPAWEKIIPQKFITRFVLETDSLLKAVKLSSVFAKDSANITKIKTTKEGKIILSSATKELGEQQTDFDLQAEGEELEVAINSRYLIDVLANCQSSQISVEFSGALSPALFKPLGQEGLEYIIMPVRLS